MHRSKFDQICSVNEISLGLLRKAHTLTRPNNGARALLKIYCEQKFSISGTAQWSKLSCFEKSQKFESA